MKKMMSLLMVAAMLSNTVFATSTVVVDHSQMITKSFNEFRYKMTVSANATNANFQAQAVTAFKASMADLQAKGVSADEIMSQMRATILDASTRADFDRMIASMNVNQISSEDAGNMAMEFMSSKYAQGASYSGGGKANIKIIAVIIGVIIVGVVTYICIKHNKDKTNTNTTTTTDTGTQTQTNTETNTNTETQTDTNTVTQTDTGTVTITNTDTYTNTNCYYEGNYQYCND